MAKSLDDTLFNFSADTTDAINNLEALRSEMIKFSRTTKKLEDTNYNMNVFSKQLNKLTKSVAGFSGASSSISTSFSAITSAINTKSFSKLNDQLSKVDLKSLKENSDAYAKAIANLADRLSKVGKNIKLINTELNKTPKLLSKNTSKVKENKRAVDNLTNKSFYKMRAYILELYYLITRLSSVFSKFIELSVSYTENVNLFGVAMGKNLVPQAEEFINTMNKAFHLDISNIMKYMGVFQQLNVAMGMTAEQAYTISKNFTQLGIDIASLYNITIEEAYNKLESGLAGLPRPLRELGIDITENALTLTANEEAAKAAAAGNYELAEALSASIEGWTRVQKQQIIYLTILRQTKNAQGDFARTINTPANQLKILYEQLDTLQRNIGNLFYSAIADILPYFNAYIRIINDMIVSLAKFFGYEEPSAQAAADLAEDGLGAITDEAESATEAMNNLINGLDKFNVLSSATSKSNNLYAGFEGLELPDYENMMVDLRSKADEIYESLKPLKGLIEGVTIALTALASYTLLSKIASISAKINLLSGGIELLNKKSLLIVASATAIYYLVKAWNNASTTGKGFIVIGISMVAVINLIALTTDKANKKAIASFILSLKTLAKTIYKNVISALLSLNIYLKTTSINFALLGTSIGILGLGITTLSALWNKMGEGQQAIIVFTSLAAAITAAAVAMAAFKVSATSGLAAGAIAAGIVMTTGAVIASSNKVKKFKDGGLPTRGDLFIANEAGPELVGTIGGNSAVANNDMIIEGIENASYRGFKRAMEETKSSKENIDIRFSSNASDGRIVRALLPALKAELRKEGKKL